VWRSASAFDAQSKNAPAFRWAGGPAVITTITSYGAFARLDAGVEGLIHASEIDLTTGAHLKDVLSEGQSVQVRVLHVDPDHQRMGLSLRLD
jgi:small subunit ribosomal protein S1